MNYNDYDSNGNKKKFNLTDMLTDKKQRARVFLVFYVIIFLILIIIIRVGITSSNNVKQEEQKEKQDEVLDNNKEESEEDKEINEKFLFLDQNNYNFKFTIEYKYNGTTSSQIIEGKRFDNKYDFTLQYNGDVMYFLGTEDNIKAKENEQSNFIEAQFPYVYLNFFDNKLLKNIVKNASLNDDTYEISNLLLSELISSGSSKSLENKDSKNTLKLDVKNNKIVGINIDYSNVLCDYQKEEISAVVNLEYSNFGLIEDFDINFSQK